MVVVAGKGGVGKTTVSAAIACAAARSGRRVVLVDLQGNPALAATFGRPVPFGYAPVSLWAADDGPGSLTARAIDPSVALAEYLEQHGLGRVSKRLITTGVVDVVATAAPGIEDLLVLGKLKQMELSGESDLIVVDGPPAGHAVQFLLAAARLRDAVSTGPIAAQADDVLALLADPARCEVILVTLPETTPVNELVETVDALRERAGIQVATDDRERLRRGPTDRTARGFAASRRGRGGVPERAQDAPRGGARPARTSWRPASESSGCRCCRPPRSPVPRCDALGRGGRIVVTSAGGFAQAIDGARVVVCCGSGGVGKTTTAAAIGLQLARSGVRVVVITIDPAKRLADALGLAAGLSNTPARLDVGIQDGGELWACMLDTDGHLRRPRARRGRHPRAGRRDPRQPLLPQHRRWPVGHRGVHGGGEAPPAARRRPLRRDRRRHAAEPPRTRLPGGAGTPHAASSTIGCSSC